MIVLVLKAQNRQIKAWEIYFLICTIKDEWEDIVVFHCSVVLCEVGWVFFLTLDFVIFRKELEKLRDDHQRAEELRREREEELWRIHEEHRAEIQREKEKVMRMNEETQAQRDKAEAEIEYARECLQKEREACESDFLNYFFQHMCP